MKSRSSLLLALVVYNQVALSQWKCDHRIYGRPGLDDCAKALLTLPEASTKIPSSKLDDPRKFVEPQYLEPPFGECPTQLGAMEQLPKIWRYKSCRIALMSVADPSGHIIDPGPVSAWAFIESRANRIFAACLTRKLGGGFVLIADPFGNGAISLYMYAVGAPFEAILNNYMITSEPLSPPGLGSAFNDTPARITKNGSLELVSVLQSA